MVELFIFSGILFALGICGFIADYILPHISSANCSKKVVRNRYIGSLPMPDDKENRASSRKGHMP